MPEELVTLADGIERLKLGNKPFCAGCGRRPMVVILDLDTYIAESFCFTCIEIRVKARP